MKNLFSDPSYNEFHLLSDLCSANSEILGSAYPELVSNLEKVKLILDFETDTLRQLESEGEKYWKNFVKEYPTVNEQVSIWVLSFKFVNLS
jgi:hypothetical protein